jgi:hypothetical protein
MITNEGSPHFLYEGCVFHPTRTKNATSMIITVYRYV